MDACNTHLKGVKASYTHTSDINTTIIYQSTESTLTQTLIRMSDVFPYREVRVRCYVRSHAMFLQSMCSHMFGIGARQRSSVGAEVDLHMADAVCHGTRVDLISEYGPP
jgi:hypothetical protein